MAEVNYVILFLSCGTALFIGLLLLTDSCSSFISGVAEMRNIQHIIIVGIFQTLVYLFEYLLYQYNFFGQRFLGVLSNSLLFLSNILFIAAYANFVYCKYTSNTLRGRLLFLSPCLVLALLAVLNIFTPVFFSLSPGTLDYIETAWVVPVNLLPVFYLLYAAWHDFRDFRSNIHYNNLPVSLFFLPTLIGIALEFFYSDIPTIPAFCSISLIIMYLSILKQVAYIDTLSGLYTKPQMALYVNSLLAKRSSGSMVAGIMLDVNHFKQINDTYGHVTGDIAIRLIGELLKQTVRKDGLCFRYGGDEFVIIRRVSEPAQIEALMAQIDEAVEAVNATGQQVFTLSVSQGCAIYRPDADSVVTFVERMDAKMYQAKRAHQSAAESLR